LKVVRSTALDSPPRRRPIGRALLPLGLVFLSVGLSSAVVVPFLSLFLSTAVRAGPVKVTVFLVAAPLAGVIVATWMGRLSDRRPIRRQLLIAASVAGVLGTGVTAFVREYWILLALAVTAAAIAGSLFSQSFAYAQQVFARRDPAGAAMGISILRTIFSVAWVAGPPLAAVLLTAGGFGYVYTMAAVTYAIAALVATFWLDEIGAGATAPAGPPDPADSVPADDRPDASRWTLWLTAGGFTLLQCPLTLGVQALPLFIRVDLHGGIDDSGLILGLCAFLEIPLLLGFGWLATRIRLRVLLLFGASCGVAYEVVAATATVVGVLVAGQLLNALFIAAFSGLGIIYVQDMLPRNPGRATTLFTNSFPIGALLAGPLFGLAQHYGFRLAYVFCAVLCAAGFLVLLVVRPVRRAV
jgi:SET family sugar efflux transporter-like MFS transporter